MDTDGFGCVRGVVTPPYGTETLTIYFAWATSLPDEPSRKAQTSFQVVRNDRPLP